MTPLMWLNCRHHSLPGGAGLAPIRPMGPECSAARWRSGACCPRPAWFCQVTCWRAGALHAMPAWLALLHAARGMQGLRGVGERRHEARSARAFWWWFAFWGEGVGGAALCFLLPGLQDLLGRLGVCDACVPAEFVCSLFFVGLCACMCAFRRALHSFSLFVCARVGRSSSVVRVCFSAPSSSRLLCSASPLPCFSFLVLFFSFLFLSPLTSAFCSGFPSHSWLRPVWFGHLQG